MCLRLSYGQFAAPLVPQAKTHAALPTPTHLSFRKLVDNSRSKDLLLEFGCYGPMVDVYIPLYFYTHLPPGFVTFYLIMFVMLKMLCVIWTASGFVDVELKLRIR